MITEESFIDFKCPYCGEPVSFPAEYAGFAQACPNCTESVIVPQDGSDMGIALAFPVTTPRLVVRRLGPGDWRDLLELQSDEELFRLGEGRPLNEDEILQWLQSDSHVKLTTPGQAFFLGIEVQDGGKLIGYLTLTFTDAQRLQADVSVVVGQKHQRQGYAAEALAVLLSFCFDGISLHRLTGRCDSRHQAACRLFEKVGMRREGEFIQDRQINGEWANTVWYGILGEDYRAAGKASAPGGVA